MAHASPAVLGARRTAVSLVRTFVGGGTDLPRRQRNHRKLRAEESELIAQAKQDPTLFRPNACPVCGSGEAADRFSNPTGFSFARCVNGCGVYMDPVLSEEALGTLYNGDAYAGLHASPDVGSTVKPAFAADIDIILRMSGLADGQGKRLLEVGCATGSMLLSARNAGFVAEGVELNDNAAAIGRANGIAIVTGRLEDIPGEAIYDAIAARQLVEHITTPLALFTEAHRLLKKGGFLYLDTPNIDSASFSLFRERDSQVSSFGHVSLLTREGLKALGDKTHLSLEAHEYWFGTDVRLHDLVTYKLASGRFRHRMSLYRPRLLHFLNFIDGMTFGKLRSAFTPAGKFAYQRALFRK